MALLYSGLDAAAAGEVVAALEARGVPFEVRDAAIYVDGAPARRGAHGARHRGAAGQRTGGIRAARHALGLRHHEPDVRRRLLAREGGRARPHHHRLAERARGAGAPRQPGQPAVRAHAERHRLGDGDDGARRARRRPGRGDPLPRVLGGRRPRARGGRGDRFRPRRRCSAAPTSGPARPERRARPIAPRRCAPTCSGCSRRASGRAGPSSRSTSTARWTARRSRERVGRPRQPGGDLERHRGEPGDRARAERPASRSRRNLPDGDVDGGGERKLAQRERPRASGRTSRSARPGASG